MKLFDAFVAYKFIKLLSTPFEKTDAFKRGIIDKDGKILKKRNSLIDSDDKKAYPSNVYTLVWNLKKIMNKLPIVKTRLGSFAAALYLLKEETGVEYSVLAEAFSEYAGINTKDLLLLEEQGKASAMKNIRLTSHLNLSRVQQLNERYGDAELSWDELPEDEKYDIADLVFSAKEAEKISQMTKKELPGRTFKQLQKALTDATEGLVSLVEEVQLDERYGEAEVRWDDMPEDEKFDLADIAFNGDNKFATKISKMKWKQIKGAQKLELIKTMQSETDGLVTLMAESVSFDYDSIKYDLGDQFANSQNFDNREYKFWNQMIDALYNGRVQQARVIDANFDFTTYLMSDIEKGKVGKFPKSYFELIGGPELVKDAMKMRLAEDLQEKMSHQSARDHWRKINSKGVVTPIDRDKYPNREKEGLEGPYRTKKTGLTYYYDKKEGKYYNPDTDMYLDVSDILEGNEVLEGVVLTEAKFGEAQINILRKAYADAPKFPSVTSNDYKRGRELLAKLPKDALKQIADAKINFISPIARLMLSDTNPGGHFTKEDVNEAIGASGMPLIAIPSTYRFSDKDTARKFLDVVKTNYGFDTALATQDGRVVHVEFQTNDKRMQKEIRRRIGKVAREMEAQVIGEGSMKWDLDDMSGQYIVEKELTPAELKMRDKYMKDLEKEADDFKKRYGDRWMEVLAATATKMAKKKAEQVEEAKSYTSIMQVQPRSKDWKAGTLYVPQNVERGDGKLHQFKKGDQIMVHPFDGDRYVGAIQVDDPMSYFFLAKHKIILEESTKMDAWWADQVNPRSRGWKNGVLTVNIQSYDSAGRTMNLKKGDDVWYHPYNMKGQARDYKLVIAATEPRDPGTYFAINPKHLGLKGYDNVTGPANESVELDEAKKQSVFMYEFPDEKSAVKFADEINGMGKQPELMAVVGYDNDVDVYSDKELMKVKISGLADKHGGKFTGQSKQFREDIGTTTAGVAGLTPDTAGRPVSRKKKKEAEERTKSMTEERFPRHSGLVKEYKGAKVFQVSPDVYEKVTGRSKGDRWNKTLPEDMDGISVIRQYSLRNPNKPIVIQNSATGDMKYLRRRLNDQRLKHNKKDGS